MKGSRRRAIATSALSSTDGSWSRWRNSWIAVATSSSPKIMNMNENAERSAAPSAMKIARRTSASRMPMVSTFCWCSAGTAKVVMMTTKTKRLSTDRLFSTM